MQDHMYRTPMHRAPIYRGPIADERSGDVEERRREARAGKEVRERTGEETE